MTVKIFLWYYCDRTHYCQWCNAQLFYVNYAFIEKFVRNGPNYYVSKFVFHLQFNAVRVCINIMNKSIFLY